MSVKFLMWFVSKLYYLSFSDRLHYWSQWSGVLICFTLLLQLHRYNGIGSYIKYEFYILLPVMALPVALQCMAILTRYIVDYDLADYVEAAIICLMIIPVPASLIPEWFNVTWTDQYTGRFNLEPFAILAGFVVLSGFIGFISVWLRHRVS